MRHDMARHLGGCPCGQGDVPLTPIDYLKKCVLKRYNKQGANQRWFAGSVRQISLASIELSSEVKNNWEKHSLLDTIPTTNRDPLLCPYEWPSGINTSEMYFGVRKRSAFFNLAFQRPFKKYDYESEGAHLSRISKAIENGADLRSYIYYAHWNGEMKPCPCPLEPNYKEFWKDDGEGYDDEKNAFKFKEIDNKKSLIKGKTSKSNRHRVFTVDDSFEISKHSPSVWFKSNRVNGKGTVYEEETRFMSSHDEKSFSYGRELVLAIPLGEVWDKVKPFIPPDKGANEIRCWGENDWFTEEINHVKYLIIYGNFNSTAKRVFNDICRIYQVNEFFSLRSKISIDILDSNGNDIRDNDDSEIEISSSLGNIKLLITKKRGDMLQNIYILRGRIFTSEVDPVLLDCPYVDRKSVEIIPGGIEFIINATNTIAVTIDIENIPSNGFSFDLQELESSKMQREMSHTSISVVREIND